MQKALYIMMKKIYLNLYREKLKENSLSGQNSKNEKKIKIIMICRWQKHIFIQSTMMILNSKLCLRRDDFEIQLLSNKIY